MPQSTCPFNLQRDPRSAGPLIPSATRTFILNVLAGLLNDLRDVQNILAESDTTAIRVDAAIALLEIIDTSLKASAGSVEVRLPTIILNIDIDTQIASVYEWLADLLLKSQAVFVAPHRTIERFVARLHTAAASARKEGNILGDEKTQKLALHGEEAQAHGSSQKPAFQPCIHGEESISEKCMFNDHTATGNHTGPSCGCPPQPDPSSDLPSKKNNGRRFVRFNGDARVAGTAEPRLRERTAMSRRAAEERYFRRRNPSITSTAEDELDSVSPPGSEIMDESCFEDPTLADVAAVTEAMDEPQAADRSRAADGDVWCFASHVPKKPIEIDHAAEMAAWVRLQEQAVEQRKWIADCLRVAHEQRVASGAEDVWAWVNAAGIKKPTSREPVDENSIPHEPASQMSTSKHPPSDIVDPAFRTAGISIYPNAPRAESVQRQVEAMNQRSQTTGLPTPPVAFPGSTEHESALLQQLRQDASSRDDDPSTVTRGAGEPAVHVEKISVPFSPPTRDSSPALRGRYSSIDEVLASDAEARNPVGAVDGSVLSALETPRARDSSATDVRPVGCKSDHDGEGGRRSSDVGQRSCSFGPGSVAEAMARPGGGWSRRSSWTGEGYVFTS
ncbi:hypothetical protein Tdes44962_MAKER04802 [Teratosphaeria destructans]|uniref:Uncharacterized protein n=1 Tax=Teratosphaeria destructans TaxID=418781 RepID=A0A9W7SLK2_9PEZI|nr:hypothetical protein Tdes44962_MAKER04802 [Teratosphaeria destructans]